ncbi:MAG: hypothetical protein WHS38_10980 [Thermodesulforhabdaceae bacterium]
MDREGKKPGGVVLAIVSFVCFTFVMASFSYGAVLYAAPEAQGSGDCSSWTNACTLQTALSGAGSGDEIWVKAGVHYPGAAGNRTATFQLKSGVALYGGFAGTETSRDQRDWQTNKTILSGDIDKNDINTDGNYIAETTADIQGSNAYHVVTGINIDGTAVLDGFIITAGQANEIYVPHSYCGGMYNDSSSPTIANVVFSGNWAGDCGGMCNNNNSNPTLNNVTFSGNGASYCGGMCNQEYSNPTLANVTFLENSANRNGGGMCNYKSSPVLTNVTFSGNSADYGGGMYNQDYSSPVLTNVTFSENSAEWFGGGMRNAGYSSPILTNVTFSGNSAGYGGGMDNNDNSNPTLINVTFFEKLSEQQWRRNEQRQFQPHSYQRGFLWQFGIMGRRYYELQFQSRYY